MRRNSCAVAQRRASVVSAVVVAAQRPFFFGKKSAANPGAAPAQDASGASPPFGGLPKGMDFKKMQEFMKASPDQQLDTMKKALEMQKSMGKVPGIGRFALKNAEMMEKLIQMQEQKVQGKSVNPEDQKKIQNEMNSFLSEQAKQGGASPPPPPPPPKSASSTTGRPSGSGPSLDDLRKVNLGSEIEILFQELGKLRESKNTYRDKYNAREKECEDLQRDTKRLKESEESVRQKLQLAEKNVTLLNSENMELREKERELKELRAAQQKLIQRVNELQSNDTTPLLKRIQAIEAESKAKDEQLKALNRKLERARRRDLLLQFSQAAMADPLRLVPSGIVDGSSWADTAFQELRDVYDAEQAKCWRNVATSEGRAAAVMARAACEVLHAHLPQHKLDALIHVSGDIRAFQEAVKGNHWTVTPVPACDGKYVLSSSSTSSKTGGVGVLSTNTLGPYGYMCALKIAQSNPRFTAATALLKDCTIESVQPHVSADLAANPQRARIGYESCRSGGPGGQAANVSETQITAKLYIDEVMLMQAEAQDSRSAVANKESATEKLVQQRRVQWNEQAAKLDVTALRTSVVSTCADNCGPASKTYGAEYLDMLMEAVNNKYLSLSDAAAVLAVEELRAAL